MMVECKEYRVIARRPLWADVAIPKGFRGLSLVENLSFASKYDDLQQHTALRRHMGSPRQCEHWLAMTAYFLCVATEQLHDKLKFALLFRTGRRRAKTKRSVARALCLVGTADR